MTSPTPTEPNVIVRNAKAILGTLVAFGTALAVIIADPSTSSLLPTSWVQWIAAATGALVALGGVFGIRNARTVEQAQADLDKAIARQAKPRRRQTRKRSTAPRPAARHPSVALEEERRPAAPDADEH